MPKSTNKLAAIAIVILLVISIGATLTLTTDAHTPPYQYTTYAKIDVLPDPIGVGQSALGYAFLGNAPPSGSAITNTYRFHNYTVIITDPNGKVQTQYWETVIDTTGAQMFRFTPDVAGVWNITFNYGGQTLHYPADTSSTANEGDVYLPSTATCTLTVQEDPIFEYPSSYPLPTEYWTRPIYGENQDWFSVSSNWLGVGSPVLSSVSSGTISAIPSGQSSVQRFPGDAIGPLTSHVMWTKPIQEGGVVGGDAYVNYGDTYFEGSAYQQRFINPIIVYGRLFYREPVSFLGPSSGESVCVDLRTGQEIWRRNDLPTISFAYIPNIQNPNQHGVFPALLCTSNFGQCYDMWTGNSVFNVTNVPGGSTVLGPSGEWIKYNFFNNGTSTAPDWYLTMWNSTLFFRGTGYHPGETGNSPSYDTTTTSTTTNVTQTTYINGVATTQLTPVTTTTTFINASRGNRYNWMDPVKQNQSIPWRNNEASSFSFSVVAAHYDDILICRNGSYASLSGTTYTAADGKTYLNSANWTYFAINLNASKGTVGSILWWSPTYNQLNDRTITWGGDDPTARVFVEACKETQNFVGYSFNDGKKLWETNDPAVNNVQQQEITPLDYFGNPYFPYVATQAAYGKLYSLSYGGLLFCYDLQTGERLWTNGNGQTAGNNTDSGLQMPGPYPAFINAVGNGVIYTVSTQHTIITPIPKGNMARAINATDGMEIWKLSDYTGEFSQMSYAMADGYSAFMNGYDNQIYSVGRGSTALTVSAPDLSAASGQPVVIRGTVMDTSAGTKQNEQAARFANGVPCAADSIMTDWMGYVYQQKPLPTNFTGVNVNIIVLDANNNYQNLGTVETDNKGNYNFVWTPNIPGTYKVYASFSGTNGYWPSSSTTAFNVMEPAATASPQPTQPPSSVEAYFLPAIAGLFVLIIVVFIVMMAMMRKRP